MGLIKTLYDKLHKPPVAPKVVSDEEESEVRAALERADSALIAVHDKAPTVSALTDRLQDQLRRNHFAEMIEASMRPGV